MMTVVLAPHFPEVDFSRLVKICIVHDLGGIIGGDVPAPEQARRHAVDPNASKADGERRDLLTLVGPLPARRLLKLSRYPHPMRPQKRGQSTRKSGEVQRMK